TRKISAALLMPAIAPTTDPSAVRHMTNGSVVSGGLPHLTLADREARSNRRDTRRQKTRNRKRCACQREGRHAAKDAPLFVRITAACDLALLPCRALNFCAAQTTTGPEAIPPGRHFRSARAHFGRSFTGRSRTSLSFLRHGPCTRSSAFDTAAPS